MLDNESSSIAHSSDAAAALSYGYALRRHLKTKSENLGGVGDVVLTILTKDHEKTFVRLLFTKKHGLVRFAPNDEEWEVCNNWIRNYADHSGADIDDDNIIIKGDLCIIMRDKLDEESAEVDAILIINALVTAYDDELTDTLTE